ncbi:hypothetical protein [Flagellimonas beolgyonensis]|uniref:hypothetical protein n=1 Tax=Flagellimonas beolgyonensis TaxID=864064 RepID=UPI000F8ECABF|nr:hypothetical protein [Allomuricauda beolgyonensis]
MTTFLSLFFILLAVNAVLLLFSVNGAKERNTKQVRKISGSSITKMLPRETSETKYKEAV